jgi:hypothetical protein
VDGVSLNGNTAAVEASLLQAAETDTAKSAKLLKKVMDADKDMINTLLPPPSGMLDIKA